MNKKAKLLGLKDTVYQNPTGLDDDTKNYSTMKELSYIYAYSYKNDVDLDDWMEEYAANNNTYYTDQRKNYSHMVNDFEQYQKRIAVA